MKRKTDKHTWERQTQNQRATKQKLIMEFTPSTGLRLQVPLQWVPIQLMPLKNGTKWFWNNFSNCRNKMLDRKSSRLLSGNYNRVFKRQRSPHVTENGWLTVSAIILQLIFFQASHNRENLLRSQWTSIPLLVASFLYLSLILAVTNELKRQGECDCSHPMPNANSLS